MELNPTVVTVFLNGRKKFKNVKTALDGDELVIINRASDDELGRFTILETAKAPNQGPVFEAAYDIADPVGKRIRAVIQAGCGCSGMRNYTNDPEYSGALRHK